jgi:anti-sigma regulatory factor (Ser/Thr protein kinase)
MRKNFKRDLQSLDHIFAFIQNFIMENKLDEAISYTINLAIEELFTNMVKYNADNPNNILIDIVKEDDKIVITLTEFDTEPFSIEQVRTYNSTQPLHERPVGGLGIHLIKKMVDHIDYEYKDRNSTITLIKRLRKAYV